MIILVHNNFRHCILTKINEMDTSKTYWDKDYTVQYI